MWSSWNESSYPVHNVQFSAKNHSLCTLKTMVKSSLVIVGFVTVYINSTKSVFYATKNYPISSPAFNIAEEIRLILNPSS